MNEARLTNLLGIQIVPAILGELGVSDGSYAQELERLYASRLFAVLSDPATALPTEDGFLSMALLWCFTVLPV
jgi:hypothetical protein